jgi:hypothetical protein
MTSLLLTDASHQADTDRGENVQWGATKLTDGSGNVQYIPKVQIVDATGTAITSFGGGSGTPQVTQGYDALIAGTGYSIGDVLIRLETVSGSTITSTWVNATQGTILGTAPTAANLREQSEDTIIATGSIPTRSSMSATTTTGLLITANASAKRRIITNASTSAMYLIYCAANSGGSITDYTYKLLGSTTTFVASIDTEFDGYIRAVWDTATGTAYVTELV